MLAPLFFIPLGILLLLGVVFGAWFTSEKLLRVTDAEHAEPLNIVQVSMDTVTLPRNQETTASGTYSISWQDNYAILGPVTSSDDHTVTRHVVSTTDPLTPGQVVYWHPFIYKGTPERTVGIVSQPVSLFSDVGELPAWFVAGQRSTWILLVHGFRGSREGGLRLLPLLKQMGFPALLMSYRNDADAAKSPDHLYHLGDTEWQDVEAGVRYAIASGAQDVILFGWSMGGCLIETFLRRSPSVKHVRAVVFDAPVLNWEMVTNSNMRRSKAPGWFAQIALWVINQRLGLHHTTLNHLQKPRQHSIPTLLFHGTADSVVPIESSDLFAQSHLNLLTYYRVHGADHVQSWNSDQQLYENRLKDFLSQVGETPHAV
jgi:pimeloyl-ACP methyl ester carboxylesterase